VATIGPSYTAAAGQQMSPIGTVLGLEKGVLDDLFFLSFERIGTRSHAPPPPVIVQLPPPVDSDPESDVGLRTFDELNATFAQITGVSPNNPRVSATYETVKQSLPSIEKLGAFGPSQQTALAQLAIQYCNQMVETPALRTAFFGNSLNPANSGTSVFGSAGAPNNANRDIVIGALLQKGINTGLDWNPDDTVISAELDDLIDKLVAGPTGSATGGTGTVMKATCGAVLGSATTLIQ
jgi:hypothetical protein